MNLLGITAPEWFPAPEMEDGTATTEFAISPLSLFLLFVSVTLFATGTLMISGFLLSLGGKTIVRIGQEGGEVFTGVGAIGWTRRFDLSKVQDVSIAKKKKGWGSDDDSPARTEICIEQPRWKNYHVWMDVAGGAEEGLGFGLAAPLHCHPALAIRPDVKPFCSEELLLLRRTRREQIVHRLHRFSQIWLPNASAYLPSAQAGGVSPLSLSR